MFIAEKKASGFPRCHENIVVARRKFAFHAEKTAKYFSINQ